MPTPDPVLGRGAHRALPLRLELGRTTPVGGVTGHWIVSRFAAQCAGHGSRVDDDGKWLSVTPRG